MSDNLDKYLIFKYLDEETRFVGLPLDEFIPVVFFIVFGFVAKLLILGILFAASTVFFLKSLKKKRGRSALLYMIYWHGNESVGNTLFPSFPKSTERYFI